MSNTFILGIDNEVPDTYSLSTEKLFALTGHNTGNLAFHYAMTKILGSRQEFLPWHTSPAQINTMQKIGVMPCANQLGPHSDYGRLGERFSQLTIPLVAVGLGAQGDSTYEAEPVIPEGTLNWVQEIVKRAPKGLPNIGVRGPYTLKVLATHDLADRAVITGCPSLFINPRPNLGEEIKERAKRPFKRVAVAAGHQKWRHLARLEHSLVNIMEAGGGSYIVQSPVEMVALARGEASQLTDEALTECRDYVHPDQTVPQFEAWSRQYFRAFYNISSWMEFLLGFDFVVGARIHGVMLGLQAGIPGLCIAHDSRIREMCEVMRVPFVMAKDVAHGVSVDDLREHFKFDAGEFDRNRSVLATRMNVFLGHNDIASSAWLKSISGEI